MLGAWISTSTVWAADGKAPSFSTTQAKLGSRNYASYCGTCHGMNLEGIHLSPALSGNRFDQTWRGKSLANLAFHVWRMPNKPIAAPGSLADDLYANILAYILEVNGLEAGKEPLPDSIDALKAFTIPTVPGMEYDPMVPVEKSEAQTALLNDLPAVTDEMLLNPSPNDWLHWGGTYAGHSFSPLDQITKQNVNDLKPAWRAPLVFGQSMPTPLVHQGVMYLHTFPATVLAMDASNGDILWRYKREEVKRPTKKNGIALHGNMVLVPTSDLHVVALNATTGTVIWDHEIKPESPEARRAYQLRSAPVVAGDKVIQGVTASSAPKGGFILAVDINSGEEVWRFNTIARPGEPEGNTWNDLPLDDRSGGSVWNQGTYDAELNLLYFGVAPTYDTGPLLHHAEIEGHSNIAKYTDCTVALNADTGELAWHYQHMQNDQWDLDWSFERQIVTISVDGKPRKAVVNVGKMAMLDALDAATGEYLFTVDSGVQNVVASIDPATGAKTYDPDQIPDPEDECIVCPSAFGARSWPSTAYSPQTKFVYIPITEWCMGMGPTGFRLLSSGVGLTSQPHPTLLKDGMIGRIQAIDLENQKLAWKFDQETPPSTSILATAGGVVFSGDVDPSLKAFDDTTGELLWEAALDDLPTCQVITYSVYDKQYVAVTVGMTNNHIRDITRSYRQFSKTKGASGDSGGGAIWVFALEG